MWQSFVSLKPNGIPVSRIRILRLQRAMSLYRSQKPLIVTTNLTLDEIRHPQDTTHARIYDRLLEMCVPVSCIGVSLRKENALEKLERMKLLVG